MFVHAGASELARLFARRAARVLLLAGDAPRSVTQAYAGLKLLAVRARLLSHDLLLAGTPGSARAERIATQFARCADDFVGALLHSFACIDPAAPASNPALRRFVRELLLANAPGAAPQAPEDRWHEPAAAWAA